MKAMPTVSEIGERSLIEIFMKHLTPMPGMPIPFWDDASAIDIGDGRAVVINVPHRRGQGINCGKENKT